VLWVTRDHVEDGMLRDDEVALPPEGKMQIHQSVATTMTVVRVHYFSTKSLNISMLALIMFVLGKNTFLIM